MMRVGFSASLLAVLMISAPAVLSQTRSLPVAKVLADQRQLRAELEEGSGRAARVPPEKRTDLLVRQQELLDLLEGRKSARELTPQQQVFARETLALIEAAVEDDDDERVVCRREKTLGSNMVERTCRTVAQLRLDQERAREAMLKGSRD
jgi:hypothetical protein